MKGIDWYRVFCYLGCIAFCLAFWYLVIICLTGGW